MFCRHRYACTLNVCATLQEAYIWYIKILQIEWTRDNSLFCNYENMKLTLEALNAPQYAISQNNIQEKFQRAFGKGNDEKVKRKRKEVKIKRKKIIANNMQVGVFDMLGTSANDVRAVRKWFQDKENIKYHRFTGKLLVLYLRNRYICQTTGEVLPMPNDKTINSNDRLSILYVLNDLFQRMHKLQMKKTPPQKKQRRHSDGSNVSTLSYFNTNYRGSDNSNVFLGKGTKNEMKNKTDSKEDTNYKGSASNQTSNFDYREGWKNIIPTIVVLCRQDLPSQDLASWERVISVWKMKEILSENILLQIDKLYNDNNKKLTSNINNNSSTKKKNTTSASNDDITWHKKRKR